MVPSIVQHFGITITRMNSIFMHVNFKNEVDSSKRFSVRDVIIMSDSFLFIIYNLSHLLDNYTTVRISSHFEVDQLSVL